MKYLQRNEIPISKPYVGFSEYQYVLNSLFKNIIGGASNNNFVCEETIANIVQHKYCKLTSNGTVALQVAFEAAKTYLKKEKLSIIIPNITFGATVNAALLTGNKVILADVNAETGLICRESVQKIVNEYNVDCVCLVSLNGRLVDFEDIQYYSERGLLVIEDQAEAFLSKYELEVRSKLIFMSTLSFYANKIITSGEGGAICFSNENILEWVNTYINHGMKAAGTYQHTLVGSNYRMSSFNAGLLRAQLSRIDKITLHRQKAWEQFILRTHGNANNDVYKSGEVPWLLEFKTAESANIFESRLKRKGIQYRKYFSPMDQQLAFNNLKTGSLVEGYKFVRNRYFLPLYFGMSERHLSRIIDAIKP